MRDVFICDAVRTPIGRYGGLLSSIRPDDLAAIPLKALIDRNPQIDWLAIDDVVFGCANQAGEDNRNVARMALLLAGYSATISGVTVNRLCGSGMEAIGQAARIIKSGEADLIIAGGVESMSRAPFVFGKTSEPFSRKIDFFDTTMGWRFVNKNMEKLYGVDSMIQTAENIAGDFNISRRDQDLFAHNSQAKTAKAQQNNLFDSEIIPVIIPQRNADPLIINKDEHPRLSTIEKLSTLKPVIHENGTVTAGNSSGINDGAAAVIIASEKAVKMFNLKPLARVLGMQTAGVLPRVMGMGPVPATKKLLERLKLNLRQIDVIELNEAFASQALACIRELGLEDNDPRINPLGGAIALGHPLGMSGTRIIASASYQLQKNNLSKALCTMCVGVGQGVSIVIEKA